MAPPSTSSRLLDLPTELIEWIARHTEDEDLLNLRKTCRELDAVTVPLIGNRLFRHLGFYWTDEGSMRTLAAIARSKTFCGYVHRIGISFAELQSPDEDRTMRLSAMPGTSPEQIQNRETCRRAWEILSFEHAQFWAAGGPEALFREACTAFQAYTPVPAIWSDSFTKYCYVKPTGHKPIARLLGYEECFRDWPGDGSRFGTENTNFKTIMDVMRTTRYPVEELELGVGFNQAVKLKCLWAPTFGTFRFLKSLHLDLEAQLKDWDHTLLQRSWQNSIRFCCVLFKATELSTLHLTSGHRSPIASDTGTISLDHFLLDILTLYARDKALLKLETLYLCGWMTQFESLLRFLRIRRHTLTQVQLLNIQDGIVVHKDAEHRVSEALSWPSSVAERRHLSAEQYFNSSERRVLSVDCCYSGWNWVKSSLRDDDVDEAYATSLFGPTTVPGQHCSSVVNEYLARDPLENWSLL